MDSSVKDLERWLREHHVAVLNVSFPHGPAGDVHVGLTMAKSKKYTTGVAATLSEALELARLRLGWYGMLGERKR